MLEVKLLLLAVGMLFAVLFAVLMMTISAF